MNPISLFCALLLASEVAVGAQTNPATAGTGVPALPSAPKIEFDSMVFNFGKARAGEVLKHDFVFTNSGTANLEITSVKPGCGCTTAGTWDKTVEPGKTGRIPLQFNSTGFGGQVAKSATVTCNDPFRSNLFLQVTGTVWKPIEITPAMAMFNVSSESPTNETKILKIVNNLDEPVTLSDLKCSHAAFKTELKEPKPGKEFELQVTVVPPLTNPTAFASITLKTSTTNAPMISVSAYATLVQAVAVAPQQVTLPAGPLRTPLNSSVLVRINSTITVEVSDAALAVPGVDVKLVPSQPGRLYAIHLTFPVGFDLPAGQKAELTFKTSHPAFPLVKVPVIQMRPVAATPAASTASAAAAPGSAAPGVLQPASPVRPRPLVASPPPTLPPVPAAGK